MIRQGMNYQLGGKFWSEFEDNFGLCKNPVKSMPQPSSKPVPLGLVEAMKKCHNTNTCIRGRGFRTLKVEFTMPGPFNDCVFYGVASNCYGTPGQSKAFKDDLMLAALTFFARNRGIQDK